MSSTQNKVSPRWAIVAVGAAVIVAGVGIAIYLRPQTRVTDFESCKVAGGMILETYPEQCTINGSSYTNQAQAVPEYPDTSVNESDYIGLSESEALANAEKDNTPARVVERDGESLPVTMDFVFGRLNLYEKDGMVYKVEIEGQATDQG